MKKLIRKELLARVRTCGDIGLPRATVVRLVLDVFPQCAERDVADAIDYALAKGFLAKKPSALDAGDERLILTGAGYDVLDAANFAS